VIAARTMMSLRLAVVAAATAALAGCTQPIPPADFTGPWAELFEDAYVRSDSEYVRAILKDEVITDQEYSETFERYRECDAALGITLGPVEPGGGGSFSIPPGMGSDGAVQADAQCSERTGEKWVGMLYWAVRANPENLDGLTILIDCLVNAGVVEPGYTPEDYHRDTMQEGPFFPFKDFKRDKPLYDACTTDPLGLLE
jgi:hypothetical protein